jgi:NAD(P)-dependent dehydrogenase (short-subunit alcohol dehydrogenase family)
VNDLFSLEGRTALVTGGSHGIGAAIATEFLRAGARVIICSRDAAELEDAAGEGVPADLSSKQGAEALAREVAERTEKLDVLVNNAGTTWVAPIGDYPEAGWDKVMNLNLKSLYYLTASCLPLLRAAATEESPARVINIGSIDGIDASVFENYAYSASKAAVHQLTRQLARRLAPDHILVNAIAPGLFPSRMTTFISNDENLSQMASAMIPRGRMGRPEEIGGTAVYLASRAGGYTTGEILVVDGGRSGAGRAD